MTPPRLATNDGNRRRPSRRRPVRLVAATLATGLTMAGAAVLASPPANAADLPQAQAVGNYLDALVNGNTIDQLARLDYATATAPGTTSAQNPLNATALNAINLPLTGALQLPGANAIQLGAVQQLAAAHTDGYSYGAAGAVRNSGGVAVGGDNSAPSADATINLSTALLTSGLPGLPSLPSLPIPLPVPSGGAATSTATAGLGSVQAAISGDWAIAQTKVGGEVVTPQYGIASLKLTLGSPALGGLLSTLAAGSTTLTSLLSTLTGAVGAGSPLPSLPALPTIPGLPLAGLLGGLTSLGGSTGTTTSPATSTGQANCALTSGTLPSTISLDPDTYDPSQGAAVTVDAKTGTITINVNALLDVLLQKKDAIDGLPANTDLTDYVVKNLPNILSTGLESVINGITAPVQAFGASCLGLLPTALQSALGSVFTALSSGQATLESTVNSVAGMLGSTGSAGLGAIASGLKQLIDIGANVEYGPGAAASNTDYPFTSKLAATAKQGLPLVAKQSGVRALEIHLIGDPLATIGLANAAAGPSTPVKTTVKPDAVKATAATNGRGISDIPTAVSAGYDKQPSKLPLPIIGLIVGLVVAGGGALIWKFRLIRSTR